MAGFLACDKRNYDKSPGEIGLSSPIGDFAQLDIRNLELTDDASKAFFLRSDDDLGNLTEAMMLAGEGNSGHIYVRMTHWPIAAVTDHLGEERKVAPVYPAASACDRSAKGDGP